MEEIGHLTSAKGGLVKCVWERPGMVARELENGGPDGPVSLENLLQGRRTESGIDGRVQGEIEKSLAEFLDRGQMHKVKHRQRGSKKMQSAADDGLGRSLHVNVDRWGRRLGFGVEQLAEEMAIVPGLA